MKNIPPTRATLEQHVKRVTYKAGHVRGQTLLTTPALLSPTNWGWTKTLDSLYEPNGLWVAKARSCDKEA